MADLRTRHANRVVERMAAERPGDLLETIVPRSIQVAEEPERGRPTVAGSPSSRAGRAFQALAEEILSRHSRERAEDEAAALPDAPEPAPAAEDLQAWEEVLRNLPGDDAENNAVPRWSYE
jgi:chromosome partitioning protein